MFLKNKSHGEHLHRPRRLPRIVELWHLLSLDAPSVAALWAWAFARECGVHLPAAALATLALGTWLVYVADRLLDGYLHKEDLRERHLFHMQHRRAFMVAACAGVVVLAILVVYSMPTRARQEDTFLFIIAMVYFAAVHLGRYLQLQKELFVGLIFAVATAIPALSRIDIVGGGTQLALPLFTFALLCWLNCWAIDVWESNSIDRRRLNSIVSKFSLALAVALGIIAYATSGQIAGISAFSATLLYVLDRQRAHWSTLALRVAADAALLTPLVLILADYLRESA